MNTILMVETGVVKQPRVIAVFPYPEVPEGYTHGTNFNFVDSVRVPFGPHNLFDAFGVDVYQKLDQKVLCCYFHASDCVFSMCQIRLYQKKWHIFYRRIQRKCCLTIKNTI